MLECVGVLRCHNYVQSCDFSRDGDHVITGESNGDVKVSDDVIDVIDATCGVIAKDSDPLGSGKQSFFLKVLVYLVVMKWRVSL